VGPARQDRPHFKFLRDDIVKWAGVVKKLETR
jgi:hypothetical protein